MSINSRRRATGTVKEKDKERINRYFSRVAVKNEETESSGKGPCHVGKGEREEVASKRIDHLPSDT